MFNIPKLPFNAKKVQVSLLKLVAFDIVRTEELYGNIFGFGETQSYN